ncbi:hypothetical protein PTTG_25392 [Puccinia triticina 1-1 BBBD Race 1]|uniref:Uncharacterized protein n=1 Tax=Puccinia triticina (isolate 1-1 / race 1 (BBBD)) TaxID=630390 RepID=A0A180H518_PUCT1|nr:hypothetical protein PTTG_25392 [Puccinia triticina 1-1 BBBD Race 1]
MADDAAALRARVEELAATIQEERGLRQRAKAKLAAAQAGMVSPAIIPLVPGQPPNAPQAPEDASVKGPKVDLPDKYNGTLWCSVPVDSASGRPLLKAVAKRQYHYFKYD